MMFRRRRRAMVPASAREPDPGLPMFASGLQAAYNPNLPYYVPTAYTAGKVFFVKSGQAYVCSGTIVNSEGRDSVWTAGHCVHDGGSGGQYHRNWVFVPSYSYGWAPYGVWSARLLFSTAGWINNRDFASDMAVAIMNPNAKKSRNIHSIQSGAPMSEYSRNVTPISTASTWMARRARVMTRW